MFIDIYNTFSCKYMKFINKYKKTVCKYLNWLEFQIPAFQAFCKTALTSYLLPYIQQPRPLDPPLKLSLPCYDHTKKATREGTS